MAIQDCLDSVLTKGEQQHLRSLLKKQGVDINNREAVLEAIEDGMTDAALEYHRRKLQAVRDFDNMAPITRVHEAGGDAAAVAADHVGVSGRVQVGDLGFTSMETDIRSVIHQAWSYVGDKLESFRPKLFGLLRSPERQMMLLRALYKETVDDKDAMIASKALSDMFEMLRRHFNIQGGGIQKLEVWNLPQFHDALRIRDVEFEEWFEFIDPLLNKEQMNKHLPILDETGKAYGLRKVEGVDNPYHDFMRGVYMSLRSDGTRKLNVKPFIRAGKGVGGRHQHHRLLHFKDADSWKNYADKFGRTSDVFEAINNYIEMMAKEIGMMKKFGPNADLGFNAMVNRVRRLKEDRNAGTLAVSMYDSITQKATGANVRASNVFGAIRNLQVLKLGMAPLSAISDPVFSGLTTAVNGMRVTRMYKNYFKYLLSTGQEGRQLAARLAIPADFVINKSAALYRYGDASGFAKFARLADFSVRASGLNHMTYAAKYAFGMEFMQTLGELSTKTWDQIPKRVRQSLERYGLTGNEWNAKIHNTQLYNYGGAQFLDIQALRSPEVMSKINGAMISEMALAVPESTARTRALLGGGKYSNSMANEFIRTLTVFKSFPVTVAALHFRRILNMEENLSRVGYLSALLGFTTFMGTMSYQAKEIAQGRKTADWDNVHTWKMGLRQAAGFDIIAEALFPSTGNRSWRQVFSSTLAGPAGADFDFLIGEMFLGSIDAAFDAEKKFLDHVRRTGTLGIMKYTPGQFWWTRLLIHRGMWDYMNKAADPRWYQKQRSIRRRYREQGRAWRVKPGQFW